MKILFPYMGRWKAVNWTRYHSLLNCMAEMGHEILILQPPPLRSMETNFQEIDVELHPNITLLDVEVNRFFWEREMPLNKLVKKGVCSLASFRMAKRLAASGGFDAVLLYNIPQYPFLRIEKGVKIFDYADDYMEMLAHELGALSNPLLLGAGSRLLDRMVRESDIVLAVSHMLAAKIDGNVEVIPNGVDLKKIEAGLERLDLGLARPVVGFLGAFEYFIDFDVILGAASRLPHCTFLMVGTGREWERVSAEVRGRGLENVVLTGGVPHAKVFSYIDAMDICLNVFRKIPISHNACPIKLFEYLAMKKPVISTRLDELRHIDRDFLFYADSAEELAGRVEEILSDPSRASLRAERGYAETAANFTWQGIAERLLSVIERAAGG
ncbi:MAG TPA: glycosyltransferase [Deltaproteobacteria bacterium]|nr:glycosyltransferase [Deltaproteobacteria bacterium]